MITGASLTWSNLTCKVDKKSCFRKQSKTLLDNTSGSVKAGEILAILGPSGAGKSTLLNCLSENNCAGYKTTGNIFVDGYRMKNKMHSVSAYVEQNCEFFEKLTVYEHLVFHAKLSGIQPSELEFRVQEVIDLLDMTDYLNSKIGCQGRGLSGGERKRLSFAAEIMVQPQLLFADEPTSGLDSFLASKVLDTIKKISAVGTTIIFTIHQPSSVLFSKLDNIYLLDGGKKVISGKATDVSKEFTNAIGMNCPVGYNLADWYLDFIGSKSEKLMLLNPDLDNQDKNADSIFTISSAETSINHVKVTKWSKFITAVSRAWRLQIRDTNIILLRYGNSLFIAFLLGMFYYREDANYVGISETKGIPWLSDEIQDLNGCIFMVILINVMMNMFFVCLHFTQAKSKWRREHYSGLLPISYNYLASTVVEIVLYTLPSSIIFSAIVYVLTKLHQSKNAILIHFVGQVLLANVGVSFGYRVILMFCFIKWMK